MRTHKDLLVKRLQAVGRPARVQLLTLQTRVGLGMEAPKSCKSRRHDGHRVRVVAERGHESREISVDVGVVEDLILKESLLRLSWLR